MAKRSMSAVSGRTAKPGWGPEITTPLSGSGMKSKIISLCHSPFIADLGEYALI